MYVFQYGLPVIGLVYRQAQETSIGNQLVIGKVLVSVTLSATSTACTYATGAH
jgi:hypothetical protein